jgi:DNA-directed RNA polymerase specialized sigma24 family protein
MAAECARWQHYFQEWGPSLLLFARQQTGFLSEAEDIVQEAFIKVWKTYGQSSSITKSLFYAAVRTTAIDHARSISRRKFESTRPSKKEKETWNYLKGIWKFRKEIPYLKKPYSNFQETNRRL